MRKLGNNYILAWLWILGLFLLALRPIEAFDTFWQLQSGKYIWQTGQFIYQDTFSLASDLFRLEHCWLHDIILYITYVAGGYPLLSLLKPLLITICGGLLLRWALKKGVDLAYALPVLTLCLIASADSWLLRPQLWTFLFGLLYLHLLYLGRERGGRAWFWMIPLMLIWANLHAACIFGFALIAAFWIGELWRAWRGTASWRSLGTLTFCSLLTFAAAFVNPYGYRIPVGQLLGHLNQYQVATGDAPIGMLGNMEWLPPNFEQVPWFYVVMALWGVTILWRLCRRRMDVAEIVFFVGFSYMGFSQIRHTTLVALLAGYFLPVAMQDIFKPLLSKVTQQKMVDGALKWGTIALLVVMILFEGSRGVLGVGLKASDYPIKATEFLANNKLPATIYNAYDWGGYLMWQLYPDYLVFIDGRSTSNKHFRDSIEIELARPGWEDVLDEYGINTIITRTCFSDTGGPLNLIDGLARDNRWALVYSDDVAVVYIRRIAAERDFLAQNAQPMKSAFATMFAEASRLYSEDGSRKRSLLAMGRAAMRLGRHTEALSAYQKFLGFYPDDQEAKRAVSVLSRWVK